jgi:hypothetical protein
LGLVIALDWQADSFGVVPSEQLRMSRLESQVASRAVFWGEHLVRLPSAVRGSLGIAVGSGSRFLATFQFSAVLPLSQHRFGKESNSPDNGRQIYRRNPPQHRLVVRIATPMDIRYSPFPRLCQRDDLLAAVFRIFLPSHQTQLNKSVDRSAERALVEFQPIGESLEVHAPESTQLEQDVTLRNRDAAAIRLVLETPSNLAFEQPKLCSKGTQHINIQVPFHGPASSCYNQLLYTATVRPLQ